MQYDDDGAESAFGFDGTWQEFAPIAFTNLLLTIVTLGIYRFWATTRERQYFWSRTRFVDERLEWAGTGWSCSSASCWCWCCSAFPM